MRASGKWQAQLYYAGKSRYLGVFIRKEAAAMGYEVARELLKEGKEVNGIRVLGKKKLSAGQTDDLLTVARRAARKAGEIVEGYSYKYACGLGEVATAISAADEVLIDAAIATVQSRYGTGSEGDRRLDSLTLGGVKRHSSGKWQAQLHFAGRSRYLGIFQSKEAAALGCEVARELLRTDCDVDDIGKVDQTAGETKERMALARKAARKARELV